MSDATPPTDSIEPNVPHVDEMDSDEQPSGGVSMSYTRFFGMIATSGVAMFVLMYLNTYEGAHVQWGETRFYMTFVMVAVMAVFAGALWLVRTQRTVQDSSWMRAMIPHHSIAILTSERAEIDDIRVRELAVEIIEAQQREIDEMKWLIDDIGENGKELTQDEATERRVPEFTGISLRSCSD